MPAYAWIAIGGTVAAIVVAALILALNNKIKNKDDGNYTTIRTMDYSMADLTQWYKRNKKTPEDKVFVASIKSFMSNANCSEALQKANINIPQDENAIILAVLDGKENIKSVNLVIYDSIEDELIQLLDSNNGVVILED